MKRVLTFILTTLLLCVQAMAYTVVIDPGHGGRDVGAVGRISREKDINLKVALALGDLIKKNYPGIRVVYTRSKDTFVELGRRAAIANKAKADLFISIHTNSTAAGRKGTTAQGTETYTLGMHRVADNLAVAQRENSVITLEANYEQTYEGFNPNSSESYIIFEFMQDQYMASSVDFARLIQKQFATTAKRVNKGVHQAGFLVLREVSMPSVLVEVGYCTNKTEAGRLKSATHRYRLAQGIADGIHSYAKSLSPKKK